MHVFAVLAIAVATIALQATRPQPANWTTIRPQVTTQAELTARFGPPDEVVATFPWAEWSATWKKRPVSRNYVLRYARHASQSPLLEGPVGAADSVDVTISDKKVLAVEWKHGGPSARAAAAAARADKQMNVGEEGAITQFTKDVPGGWLVVEVNRNETTVHVSLELK